MKTSIVAVVWDQDNGCNSYQDLLEFGRESGITLSEIEAFDVAHLERILTTIFKETGGKLDYHIISRDGEKLYYRKDFHQSNCLVCWSEGSYESYEQAKESVAIYESASTMDDLEVGGKSGIGFDLSEVLEAQRDCLGAEGINHGILDIHGRFVEIPFVIEDL